MKLGIDNYCYHELLSQGGGWSIQDFLERAGELGVAGVSLETVFMPSTDEGFLRSLRQRLDERRLERVLAWGHPDGLQCGKSLAAAEDLRRNLRSARLLGASTMRIVAGSYRTYHEPHDTQMHLLVSILRDVVPLAEEQGVVMALENHLDFTTAELLQILAGVDSPFLRITFDTGNAFRLGENPVESARRIGPYVAATHLKDVVEGPPDADRPAVRWPSVPLGSGVVDIPGVVRELAHAGYAGLLCVEIDVMADVGMSRDSAVAKSVGYLRDIATKN